MSQSKFILSSPETKTAGDVNWKFCFICQNSFDNSPLTSPCRGRGRGRSSGSNTISATGGSYTTVTSNIYAWQNCCDRIPRLLYQRICLYRKNSDLQQAFVENSAVFHKKCVAYYTNIRLQDAVKKRHLEDNGNTISPKKTRRSLSTTAESGKCFFCDGADAEIKCRTHALDSFVRSRAIAINDQGNR